MDMVGKPYGGKELCRLAALASEARLRWLGKPYIGKEMCRLPTPGLHVSAFVFACSSGQECRAAEATTLK